MYKQTIPIPTLPTNESACFTAACSALFSVFVSFAYPTCSLYPLASYSFPSVLVACPLLLPLVSHWSIPCCPTPSLLTMLTKTFSPQCFPYFSRGLRCHKFFSVLFYFEACFRPVFLLPGASHAKGPPCFRWHPPISRQSLSISQLLALYIYPHD